MEWFKFYNSKWLSDLAIISLDPIDRLCFITLLCVTASNDARNGEITQYDEKRLLMLTHLMQEDYQKGVGFTERLVVAGLIEKLSDGKIRICNFERRQMSNFSGAERARRYRENNPEKSRRSTYASKLKRMGIDITEWDRMVEEKYGGKCAICGSMDKIELDHIIPKSKGGGNEMANLQPLCKSCNARKKDVTPASHKSNARVEESRVDKKRVEREYSSISFLRNIPENIISDLSVKYKIDPKGIKSKAYDLVLYCEQKGKRYSNYKSFLENAIRKDKNKLQVNFPYVEPKEIKEQEKPLTPEQIQRNRELKAGIANMLRSKT